MVKPKDKGGLGFRLLDNDHCLFLQHDAIMIHWVDDAIFVHKDPKVTDEIIVDLERCGFSINKEESDGGLANYLRVSINKGPEGMLILRQVSLFDWIIEATGMQDANPKSTPATEVLIRSLDAPPFDESYNYHSVIGMSNYICNTTHPECTFTVYQCTRFSANPHKPHAAAVKCVVAYLKETHDKGMVLHPFTSTGNHVDTYVDVDFAGLCSHEDPQDPTSACSWMGFVIQVGENPVFLASHLQTEMANSTMAAEYIAASAAMKALILLHHLHQDISSTLQLPFNPESNNVDQLWG